MSNFLGLKSMGKVGWAVEGGGGGGGVGWLRVSRAG